MRVRVGTRARVACRCATTSSDHAYEEGVPCSVEARRRLLALVRVRVRDRVRDRVRLRLRVRRASAALSRSSATW